MTQRKKNSDRYVVASTKYDEAELRTLVATVFQSESDNRDEACTNFAEADIAFTIEVDLMNDSASIRSTRDCFESNASYVANVLYSFMLAFERERSNTFKTFDVDYSHSLK